jgi:hypothetical protein
MSRQGGYPSDNNPEREDVRQGGYGQNQPSGRGERYPERRDYTNDYINLGQNDRRADGGNGYIADYNAGYTDDEERGRRSAIPFRGQRQQAQSGQRGTAERRLTFEDIFQGSDDESGEDGESSHTGRWGKEG